MIARLRAWLEHRIALRKIIGALLIEDIPGGAKWRYVWGSTLAFVFTIQVITGIMLMTAYSPGDSTAWGSVHYIQYQMDFGWFIRGLHHFGSQAMVVLMAIHMLQVVIAGAHLPPREINWWLGLLLMGAVLGLSLTGYLLPWDQKGFWATRVATNIAGTLPLAGPFLKQIVVGGPEYGHSTLTRFYALHVGILPPLIVVLVVAHVALFRRHGITTPTTQHGKVPANGESPSPTTTAHANGKIGWFWPDQAFRDMVACIAVFAILVTLVMLGHGHHVEAPAAESGQERGLYETWAKAGREGKGANLDAPANREKQYPARPEWYFLFLFQLLKYFEGENEIIGTVVIPQAVGILLFILPFLGHGRLRRLGHIFGVLVVTAILTGVATLTCLALAQDLLDPMARTLFAQLGLVVFPALAGLFLLYLTILAVLKDGAARTLISGVGAVALFALVGGTGYLIYAGQSQQIPEPVSQALSDKVEKLSKEDQAQLEDFHKKMKEAEADGARAVQLAMDGIPAEGGVFLLRRDPKTRGRELFKTNCAACHSFTNPDGKDEFGHDKYTASDLGYFGNKKWLDQMLIDPDHVDLFGRGSFKGGIMKRWVDSRRKTPEAAQKFKQSTDLIASWLSEHPRTRPDPKKTSEAQLKGYAAYQNLCARCHTFAGTGGTSIDLGPDLTGYGDADWLRLMVTAPYSLQRYGRGLRNEMPAFVDFDGIDGILAKDQLELAQRDLAEATLQKLRKDAEDSGKPLDAKQEEVKTREIMARAHKATAAMNLSTVDRELIIRFIQRDYRVVFGGSKISGPKKQ